MPADLVELYLDCMSEACRTLRETPSLETVRAEAHRAKGASGVVGALDMVQLFGDVERRASAGEAICPSILDRIERLIATMRQASIAHGAAEVP